MNSHQLEVNVSIRDHRGQGGNAGFPVPQGGWGNMSGADVRDHRTDESQIIRDHRSSKVKHIFVLMMENRSFDHLLGFSRITGTDAATGQPTQIEGLNQNGHIQSNVFDSTTFVVSPDAPDRIINEPGPGHMFSDVLTQLCGQGAKLTPNGPYPYVNNSGFVASYHANGATNPGDVMRCFNPDSLPVLTQLAREFVVCDHWFSSMPGPTEPNRMFVHAATSRDYDDSPSGAKQGSTIFGIDADFILAWPTDGQAHIHHGFTFPGGTIFSRLRAAKLPFRIYTDDGTPNAAELNDIELTDIHSYERFADDINSGNYEPVYTFIEPDYDTALIEESSVGGNSQHPRGSVAAGERFIKETYEAIRRSPLWGESMTIVTYDEHGGFYDHVAPPPGRPTGSVGSDHGFTFDRLGPRVPTIVISPLAPRNLVEHRHFDHCAILATVERVFGLPPLLERDKLGSGLNHLITLDTPRTDAPVTLVEALKSTPAPDDIAPPAGTSLADSPDHSLDSELRAALLNQLRAAPADQREAILQRAQQVTTYGAARAYLSASRTSARANAVGQRHVPDLGRTID
ncbi:alkaline phosphatase family protein [Mycobacterium sp. MMS18-G62]